MSTGKGYLHDLPTLSYDRKNDLTSNDEHGKNDTNSKLSNEMSDEAKQSCDTIDRKKGAKGGSSVVKFPHTFVKISYEDIELGECCGEGTFGTVYRARWKSEGRKDVAVKTLSRMDDEVHILSILSHRNIIQFYGACADMPNYCLVTEYAPYGSLYSFLASPKSEKLEFAQILSWARDVALGMNYLHEEAPIQVVHRDLKSKNVLICHDFTLKICDFGASRLFDETTVMTIAGTYPWMAPELIQGLPTSEACDVYSYGVVLWELLTKEVPFKGLQGFQVAWIVVEKHERPLIPTSCPKRFGDLMRSSWSDDVDERPTFSEVVVELNQMITDTELEQETDSFVHAKSDWIGEVQSKMKDIHHEESKLEAEKDGAKERAGILKQWAEKLRDELKGKSLFNFQYSKTHKSFNCEISGTGGGAVDTVKDAISHMMSKGGLQQNKPKEEKFGMKPDNFRSSNGTSPLFGMPLSRQGSSSSMESSRSLSMHSDMTYDVTKMNIDTSPVKFMDSNDGFTFPKSKEKQSPLGSGVSKLKLQKQMSASSEEYQFEGMKVSRSGKGNDGSGAGTPEAKDGKETWESATGKARVNQTNESLNIETESSPECPSETSNTVIPRQETVLPSVEMLEKALRRIDFTDDILNDTAALAKKVNEQLLRISNFSPLRRSKATYDGFDSPLSPDLSTNSVPRCKCQARSPPFIKTMPTFSLSQKPPLKLSPTKIACQIPFTTDRISDAIASRPKATCKSVKTQTEVSGLIHDRKSDSATQTDANVSDLNDEKKHVPQNFHVSRLEIAALDTAVSEGGDYVHVNLEKLLPQKSAVYINHGGYDDEDDSVTGQAFKNPPVKNVSMNGNSTHELEEKTRRISLPSRFPGGFGQGARGRLVHTSSFDSERESLFARQSSSARLPHGRGNGVTSHQSDIYETEDFTYIICPNKSRHKFF